MKLLASVIALIFLVTVSFIAFGRPLGFQWDFFVFYHAALSWRLGLNPYDFSQLASKVTLTLPPSMSFTYPPHALFFFLPFSFLSQAWAATAWMIVKCVLLAVFLWAGRFVHHFDWRKPSDIALLVFGLNSTLLWDITSGNTTLLESALIWMALVCLEKNHDLLFGVLIAVASSLKIQPIALVAIPLLIYRPMRWKAAASALGLFGCLLLLNFILVPSLFNEFLNQALSRVQGETGIIAPSSLAFAKDLASNMSGISVLPEAVRGFLGGLALPLYILIVGLIGIPATVRLWQSRNSPLPRAEAICLFLLTFLLTIPRVKSYSYLLILPAVAYALKRVEEKWRPTLLLLLCLPVVFPITTGVFEIYSSPQLGAIKKLQVLFYAYLPWLCTLLIWFWFYQRATAQSKNTR